MTTTAAKRCESNVCGQCAQPCVLGTLSSGLRLDLRDFPELKERHLARGDYLFHASGAFESLYAVRSGMLKVSGFLTVGCNYLVECNPSRLIP